MNWRFWKPRYTVPDLAERLASGLADGTIVLDEPFLDDAPEDNDGAKGLILEMDVPKGLPDPELLDLVKAFTQSADEGCRQHGGQGVAIRQVRIYNMNVDEKEVRVAFTVAAFYIDTSALEAVALNLRNRPRPDAVRLLNVRTV